MNEVEERSIRKAPFIEFQGLEALRRNGPVRVHFRRGKLVLSRFTDHRELPRTIEDNGGPPRGRPLPFYALEVSLELSDEPSIMAAISRAISP